MAEQFNPADYLDGGKKKFDGKDYSGLKGMDTKKILAIANARADAKVKESSVVKVDQSAATDLLKNAYPTYSATKDSQKANEAMISPTAPIVATAVPATEPRIAVGNMNGLAAPVAAPTVVGETYEAINNINFSSSALNKIKALKINLVPGNHGLQFMPSDNLVLESTSTIGNKTDTHNGPITFDKTTNTINYTNGVFSVRNNDGSYEMWEMKVSPQKKAEPKETTEKFEKDIGETIEKHIKDTYKKDVKITFGETTLPFTSKYTPHRAMFINGAAEINFQPSIKNGEWKEKSVLIEEMKKVVDAQYKIPTSAPAPVEKKNNTKTISTLDTLLPVDANNLKDYGVTFTQEGGDRYIRVPRNTPVEQRLIKDGQTMTVATMPDTLGTKLDPDTLSVQTKIEGGKLIVTMPCKDGSTDIFIITKNSPSAPQVNVDKKIEAKLDTTTSSTQEKLAPAENLKPTESIATAPHTIANALMAIEQFVNAKGEKWQMSDPAGKKFMEQYENLKGDLGNTNVKKLFESKAGNKVGPINDFLKSKGFSIKLKDQGEGFYVASVFKQEVKWENPGTAGKLKLDSNKEVDAVMGMKNVDRYNYNGNKIYSLKTTDGTEVYMMPDKGPTPKDPIVLSNMISTVDRNKTSISQNKAGLNFPMVDFRESGDIKGLIGARLGKNTINEAKYENAFKMDEKGAIAEAAAAIGGTRGIGIQAMPDEIKGPMIVWFKKEGVITFGTRVGEDAMKKPA